MVEKVMRVRIVDSVLKYCKSIGGEWFVVEREGVLGLENKDKSMRVREKLNGEKSGSFWDVKVEV